MSEDQENKERFLGMEQVHWIAIGSLSAICAVLTFGFGIYQFWASLEAKRAEQTLEMVKLWREDDYRENYILLANLAEEVMHRNLSEEDYAYLRTSEEARTLAAAKLAPLIMNEDPLTERALDEVVYFFNLLGLCVEAKLCSLRTSAGFFDQTLLSFYSIFESEIRVRQSQRFDYANGLVTLAQKFSE